MFACDRSAWPRCLAWPLSPQGATPPGQQLWLIVLMLLWKNALVAYTQDPASAWRPGWDPEDIADLSDDMPAHTKIWTDGSREEDVNALVGVAGAGAFGRSVPWVFDCGAWRHGTGP